MKKQGKLCDKWAMSERWAIATKAAIAESILNLTRLDEVYRTHDNCIKTATLWLALASLCVLDREHVEKYSISSTSYHFHIHFPLVIHFCYSCN